MVSRTVLMALLFAFAISGYPLLAAVVTLAGEPDTRLPSILLRVGVALLGVWVLIANRRSLRMHSLPFTAAMIVFWSMYLFRVVNDAYLEQASLPFDPMALLGMSLLFVLMPTIPVLVGLNPTSTRQAFKALTIVTAIAVVLILIQSADLASQLRDEGATRLELGRLNPISVGNLGGTLLLLCAVGLFRSLGRLGPVSAGLYGLGVIAGAFTMMIAAARGPVVAALLALLVYSMIPIRLGRLLITGAVGLGLAVFVSQSQRFIQAEFEFDLFKRFRDAIEGYSGSAASREASFAGAFEQFLDNPLFGDSIVEKSTQFYPHNSILEALMATGLVGGIAYFVCLALTGIAIIRLLIRQDGYEWLAVLAVYSTVAMQFSGAHFGAGVHWMTMLAVVVTELKMRPFAEADQRRRMRAAVQAQDTGPATPRSLVEKQLMTADKPAPTE